MTLVKYYAMETGLTDLNYIRTNYRIVFLKEYHVSFNSLRVCTDLIQLPIVSTCNPPPIPPTQPNQNTILGQKVQSSVFYRSDE